MNLTTRAHCFFITLATLAVLRLLGGNTFKINRIETLGHIERNLCGLCTYVVRYLKALPNWCMFFHHHSNLSCTSAKRLRCLRW